MATKKGREQSKRETWESLKEEGNKLFSHRKYEQGNKEVLDSIKGIVEKFFDFIRNFCIQARNLLHSRESTEKTRFRKF